MSETWYIQSPAKANLCVVYCKSYLGKKLHIQWKGGNYMNWIRLHRIKWETISFKIYSEPKYFWHRKCESTLFFAICLWNPSVSVWIQQNLELLFCFDRGHLRHHPELRYFLCHIWCCDLPCWSNFLASSKDKSLGAKSRSYDHDARPGNVPAVTKRKWWRRKWRHRKRG